MVDHLYAGTVGMGRAVPTTRARDRLAIYSLLERRRRKNTRIHSSPDRIESNAG